ncbi:MAG: radical SAM protein [Ilumatobacteraceae bacterium]
MTHSTAVTLTSTTRPPGPDEDPRHPARWRRRGLLLRFSVGVLAKKYVLRGLPVQPRAAELFVTDNCNLRCISCACWRTHTRDELTTAEWKRVITELAEVGVVKINFTGGEALIRHDLLELIDHARAQGVGDLHLNSNGLLLSRAKVHALLGAGVRSFNVSIDGPDAAAHDGVRGRDGAFARTVANLRYLLLLREQLSLRVRMNMTVLEPTVSRLEEMADLARNLDVPLYLNLGTDKTFLFRDDSVSAAVAVVAERAADGVRPLEAAELTLDPRIPGPSELEYIKHFFGASSAFSARRDPPCAESLLKILVHSTGEVGGCWGEHLEFNVREHRIDAVLRDRAYRDAHSKWFRKECVRCGSNYALNLRFDPRSYAFDLRRRVQARMLVRR